MRVHQAKLGSGGVQENLAEEGKVLKLIWQRKEGREGGMRSEMREKSWKLLTCTLQNQIEILSLGKEREEEADTKRSLMVNNQWSMDNDPE